jgi:hypothetical protein
MSSELRSRNDDDDDGAATSHGGGAGGETRRVAPFVSKLYEISMRFPDVCGFGANGDTIIVHDAKVVPGGLLDFESNRV